ncbi:DNA helicase [Salmonella enterica subsp. diarizonae]|nr:DNA helicase [Salmonella enterica subsp. diarizonae]EAQ0534486.1 DNA helicase [Salmonella enterica]EAS6511506.1 DNA helicase [Salmonella enterica]EBB6850577.1 DNA helicase [Salmonella enterica]EBL7408798.1 DNA helicase [Salmonella enterica]
MSLTLTDEQSAIIHWQGQKLVVNAFSCAGKTSTVVQYALANPYSRMLYLAYNRAVRDEAERKFPFNVECKNSHQLAWSRFGKHYQKRRIASLRITDVDRKLNPRHWQWGCLALTSLNQFLFSAGPGLLHPPDEDTCAGMDVSAILQAVQVRWYEKSRPDGSFPLTHDICLKLFRLPFPDQSRSRDTILSDEAQDANPETSVLVLSQPGGVILVSDRYQQIYRFCGADNGLSLPALNDADHLWLTQSFYFGPSVVWMANLLLQCAGETRLVSGNGGCDMHALMASPGGRKVYRVGGIEGYRVTAPEDLYWFSAEMPAKRLSDALWLDYRDFDDTVTSEKDVDISVSTAHSSKGLKWPVVILDEDFMDITDPQMPEDERQDETRLLYEAATRARQARVLNSLIRQLADEAGRNEQNQHATDMSPTEDIVQELESEDA